MSAIEPPKVVIQLSNQRIAVLHLSEELTAIVMPDGMAATIKHAGFEVDLKVSNGRVAVAGIGSDLLDVEVYDWNYILRQQLSIPPIHEIVEGLLCVYRAATPEIAASVHAATQQVRQ